MTQRGTAVARRPRARRVALQNLSRVFGATRALDGLSLEIEPGELVALLGPSGCGKTTALRILAGFETADSGSVTGQRPGRLARSRRPARDMGMVFQSYSLFPNMSALDNVAFGLRMRKTGRPSAEPGRGELLDMVGLADRPSSIRTSCRAASSSGSRWPARWPSSRSVLLLDEPLSALDAKVRLQLREQIRALQQRLGTTTLFVTHDQEEALSMADRVGVMRSGKLEQLATPSELYARPATAFVAEFVGAMNRIPAEPSGDGRVRVLDAALPIRGDRPDGPVDALIRPEQLRITAAANGNGTAPARTARSRSRRSSARSPGSTRCSPGT